MNATQIAARSLGYTSLKDKQTEVITNFLLGNDVFAVLPTGMGRAYATLASQRHLTLFLKQKTIVVTPLTAIIKDQVCISLSQHIYIYM